MNPDTNATPAISGLPGPIVLLRAALILYGSRIRVVLSMTCLAFVAVLLAGVVPADHVTISFFAGLLSLIVVYLTSVGLIYACADPGAKNKSYIIYYQQAWFCIGMYIWVWFLILFTVAGAAIFLVVPAVIAFVYFSLAGFTVVLEGKQGFDALIQSARYVRRSWWAVFGRIFFLGFMLALLALFLNTLFLGQSSSWWAQTVTPGNQYAVCGTYFYRIHISYVCRSQAARCS